MKAKAPDGTFEMKPVKLELNPTCRRCGQGCDLWKSQRVSTKQAIFVCSKCNTKGVQLSRLFGSWPPKMFKCMSEDEQKKFWDEIKDTPSPQLEGVVVQKLSIVRREWEEAKEGGEYLPLSVYKQRGFDVDAITARCEDKHEDPVLGTCYRVRIRTVYSGTVEAMVREELQQVKTQKVGSPTPPQVSQPPPPPVDPKTLAKEAAKQTRATKALAKKVMARIGPLVVSLEAAFNRMELLAHVPTFAVTPARTSLETLRNYYGAAKDAHTSENPRPLHFESQVVEEAAKAGTTNYQLLSQMMNTAERHIMG